MTHTLSIFILCISAQTAELPTPPENGDDEEALLSLEEELVETASRAADPIRLAPASVTVVSHEEKTDFAYNTLLDAITGVRGFYPTDDWTVPTIGARGVSSHGLYGNRIQVQLDGHVLNEDWGGGTFAALDLLTDLDPIDHIELLRGTGSSLFGTGAMLGVINLVTPRAAPTHLVRAGVSTSLSGLSRAHADGGGTLPGDVGVSLSLGILGQAPRDIASPTYEGTAWAPDGIAQEVGQKEGGTFYGRAWRGDLSLSMYAHQVTNQLAAANYATVFGDQRNHERYSRSFVELRYEPVLFEGMQLLTRAYVDYTTFEGRYVYTDLTYLVGEESYEGLWGGVEARALMTLIDGLRLAVGTDLQTHPLNTQFGVATPEPEPYIDESHPFHTGALYANADWDPFSWLRVSGGLRLDGWFHQELGTPDDPLGPRFWGAINPRLAVIWLPSDDDTFKLMAGRAFRAPSILELTYNDGDYTQGRNPDLAPESVYSAELEYTRALPFSSRVIASVYGLAITDVISQVGEGTEDDLLRYENGAEPLIVLGSELELVHALRDDVFASVSYTLAHAREGDVIEGARAVNSPIHMGALKGTYTGLGPAAHLSSRVVLESGRMDRDGNETDGAVVWDATLAGAIEALHADYSLSVRNILDDDYAVPVSGDIQEPTLPQGRRDVFATVRFHL